MSTAIASSTARVHTRRPDEVSLTSPARVEKAETEAPRLAESALGSTPTHVPSLADRTTARSGALANEAIVRQQLLDRMNGTGDATDTAAVRNGRRAFSLNAPDLTAPQLQPSVAAASTEPPATFAEVQEGLRNGRTDDAFRDGMHEVFSAASVDESHQMMEEIRNEGLLDAFLDASLRDADGNPSDPMIRDAMREMFETGRLDAYAETVTGHPFSLYAPTADQTSHYYSPSNGGIFINQDNAATLSTESLGRILAHETYHAFNHDHGGPHGALNEGIGIAAAAHAFSDDDYSISEMVYGTKNYYRDVRGDPDYPIGDLEGADPKLRDFVTQMASRDNSGLAWDDPVALENEYKFWEPFARISDDDANGINDWEQPGGYAEQAQANVEAYRAGTLPLPKEPNAWERFVSWLRGLFD